MKRNLLGVLSTVLVMVSISFGTSAQTSPDQSYICPEETQFSSDVPFTMAEVEALVGFSDPKLQDIVNLPESRWSVKPYFFYFSCTPHNDTTFVALLYLLPDDMDMRLRVFWLRAGQVVGETHLANDKAFGWHPGFMGVSGFADRNFNGRPDFFVGGSDGAKGWYSGMRILELDQAGNLQDITPIGGDIGPNCFDDLNADGIPELYDALFFLMPTFSSVMAGIQRLDQWWAWNGREYRIVAVQVAAFPDTPREPRRTGVDSGEQIDTYLNSLSLTEICASVAQESRDSYGSLRWYLFQILFYFHAWGDLNAGWEKIQPIVLVAETCADSDGKKVFFDALSEVEAYFKQTDEFNSN